MSKQRYPTAVEREKPQLADAIPEEAAQLVDQHEKRDEKKPRLKHLGGSNRDAFNIALAESARQTAWMTTDADRDEALTVVGTALTGIAPQDEVEGMLAAQMVAAHQATMECWRRSMIPTQPAAFRNECMNQANRASRTYAALLETLNKHRSKGQQRVIVEHVHRHIHVHEAGRVPDGQAEPRGDGVEIENQEQSHAQRAIGYAVEPSLRSEDTEGERVPVARNGKRPLSDARGNEPRRAKG